MSATKQTVVSALVFLLLGGCMVGPDYERPLFFSDARLEKALDLKAGAPHLAFHPIDFNDKALNVLIVKALQNSPTIRLALTKVRAARASTKIAAASLGPSLDGTAQKQYEKTSKNMGIPLNENYYDAGFDVAWELDIWGKNRRLLEQSQAQERAAFESFKNVYVSLIAEVARTYIDLKMQEELLAKAQENVSIQSQTYQLVKDKFDTGLTGFVNVNQSKYLLESTKAQMPKLKAAIQSDKNTLAVLLGVLPPDIDRLLLDKKSNLVTQKFHYPIESLKALPASVIRSRPDVRAAEENLIGQNAAVGAAVAALYPSVSVSAFLGFQSLHLSHLVEHNSYGYSYTPSVSMPLFHFGALKNNVELQKMIKEEYQTQYENQLLVAVQEISNALANLENEVKANAAYHRSYNQIANAADLLRDKYKNGLIEYADVLDSEQRRIQAQTDVITSNAALYQNIVAFYKAVGGEMNASFSGKKP